VAVRALVERRAAQDPVAPAAREAHEDVLRAAAEERRAADRTPRQPLGVHPRAEAFDVDARDLAAPVGEGCVHLASAARRPGRAAHGTGIVPRAGRLLACSLAPPPSTP